MKKSKNADGGAPSLSCSDVFSGINLAEYPQVQAAADTALGMLYEANAFQLIRQRRFFRQNIEPEIMDAVYGLVICRAIEAHKIEIDSHLPEHMPKYAEAFMQTLRKHFSNDISNYSYLFNLIEQGIAKELQPNGLRR